MDTGSVVITPSVGHTAEGHGLGRRYAPDPRDREYELTPRSMALTGPAKRRKYPWRIGPILDQGRTSECTVFTAVQIIQSAPFIHLLPWTRHQFTDTYHRARTVDEWPGENYEGTSFRAVMKVLEDAGLIREWLNCFDEDTAREYLNSRGMLGFGSEWFASMEHPSGKGAFVEPQGQRLGGHQYTMRWYYGPKHWKYPDSYEFVNSWGASWGANGIFRMKADAVRYLWHGLNGDLISPIETYRGKRRKNIP